MAATRPAGLDTHTMPVDRMKRQLLAAVVSSAPQVPEGGRLLWGWFCELHAARGYGMAGPNPISFAEIEAWARLRRLPLRPHHVDLLRAMDNAWLDRARQSQGHAAAPEGMKTLPPISGQEMSLKMFDVMFS